MTVRIATAQYPIERFGTLGAYMDKVSRWVAEAAATGAQLLVYPEYAAMEYAGYQGDAASALDAALATVADLMPEMDATIAELAARHGVHILASSGPRRGDGGRFVNAAHLFAPSGKVGVQHKCMMTPFERRWGILAGADLSVFHARLNPGCDDVTTIGIAICYDSEFPLLVRAMTQAGADLILVPSCTEFVSGANRIRAAALARALENGCAVVTSPTVGYAPWSPAVDRNAGAAGIFVPAEHGLSDTGVIVEGRLNEPGWIFGGVDIEHLRRIRTSGEMRNSLDWAEQPGAADLTLTAAVVQLF